MYYKDIGTLRPRGLTAINPPIPVDLQIELAPESGDFNPINPEWNGLGRSDKFGQINMGGRQEHMTTEDGTQNEATFIFTLMDQRTRAPLGLDKITGEEQVQFFSFKPSPSPSAQPYLSP